MKKMGLRCGAVALMGALCLTTGGVICAADEAPALCVVTHGVNVLAAETDMAVSAPIGNEAVFSADVFARALNLSKIEYVTVKSIPNVAEGELLLGSSRVAAGQVISGENLSYLTLHAADEEITHASFTFSANGSPTTMLCNVYFVSEVNYTPTVSMASGLSLSPSTHKDVKAHGVLSGYDPDGDGLIFEIVSYPENGSLRLTDKKLGSYIYTPAKGYVGGDSFTYVVRDKYGNYSGAATVNMKITVSGTSVTYADMKDSPACNAALTLTEAGVMSGKQVGNRYYFHPEEGVSRVEFLVMAMHAAGIGEVPDKEVSMFVDGTDIPESMRGYVAAAYELKYISGSLEDGKLCFLPNEQITRAQAAVILSNIVGLCDVPVTPTFADGNDIPVWAAEAIYSLNAAGIMNSQQGYITPTSPLTRAQTAQMLAAAMEYVKQ